MLFDNKISGTGSNPCHLNLDNSAKDFSDAETTNPEYGLLDFLLKSAMVYNDTFTTQPQLLEDLMPANNNS